MSAKDQQYEKAVELCELYRGEYWHPDEMDWLDLLQEFIEDLEKATGNIGGIYDEFHNSVDAIGQLSLYVKELEDRVLFLESLMLDIRIGMDEYRSIA
jgi:two-component SAPR family response regulator